MSFLKNVSFYSPSIEVSFFHIISIRKKIPVEVTDEVRYGQRDSNESHTVERNCMKPHSDRRYQILNYMSCLPVKMLRLYELDNITEFVLYDLCGKSCFNLHKAAYFVNNPDFNCLKGVAGFCSTECTLDNNLDVWSKPEVLTSHMKQSSFNQQVRTITKCSLQEQHDQRAMVEDIAKELNFPCHEYCAWDMKHNNNGLLLYQKSCHDDADIDDILLNGATLLGFCPIF